jgi:hypothetical protein
LDDADLLREQAARYRRLMQTIDDKKTRDILEALARECDDKAQKLEITDGTSTPDDNPAER